MLVVPDPADVDLPGSGGVSPGVFWDGGVAVLVEDWARVIALLDGHDGVEGPLARVQRLCAMCVDVTGVSGVALVVSSNSHRSTVWATDAVAERLEELQLTFSEGPVVDALDRGGAVLVPDLAEGGWEAGWPWFAPAAVEAGARGFFALPLHAEASRFGALSLYRSAAGGLGEAQLVDAALLAEAAGLLLTMDRGQDGPEAFMWAFDDQSRFQPQVYQAVGALSVQLGVEESEAFARLCAHAYLTDTPIGQVADEIMAGRLRLTAAEDD